MSRALLPAFGATALVAATLAAASPASALTLAGLTAPGSVDLGTVELLESATRDVVVTATAGEGSVTFGSSTVSTTTGAFSVDHETCSGTTVPEGGTCVVTVRFAPTLGVLPQDWLLVAGGTDEPDVSSFALSVQANRRHIGGPIVRQKGLNAREFSSGGPALSRGNELSGSRAGSRRPLRDGPGCTCPCRTSRSARRRAPAGRTCESGRS